MPYDSAFMFDARDCIRTKDTAYTQDGGLAILYGQLAPDGCVVKTAGISEEFKKNCGPGFVFEGPCVIFESQDDACAGILAGKVKAGDMVVIRNGGRAAGRACRKCSRRPATSSAWAWGIRLRSSPMAVSAAARRGPASAMSRPKRRKAVPSACSQAATGPHRLPQPRIDIVVPEAELAERKKTWKPIKRSPGRLARYQKQVSNASQGGILNF